MLLPNDHSPGRPLFKNLKTAPDCVISFREDRLPFSFLISGVMVVEIMTKVLNRTKVKNILTLVSRALVVVPMLILRISSYAL